MYKLFTSKAGIDYLYISESNDFFRLKPGKSECLEGREGPLCDLKVLKEDYKTHIEPLLKTHDLETFHQMVSACERPVPRMLVIEVTQDCNFRCEYCIYSECYPLEREHRESAMTPDVWEAVVAQFFERSDCPAYVSFYGGEPLLQYEEIRSFCEAVAKRGHNPRYSLTTNGSLLRKPGVSEFLVDYDFQVNVSFDGINHDCYRRTASGAPSKATVLAGLRHLRSMGEEWFESQVALTVTLAPPYDLAENAKLFETDSLLSGLRLSVSLVNETDSTFFDRFRMEAEMKKLTDDYEVLLDSYIESDAPVSAFDRALFAKPASRLEDRDMTLQHQAFPPGQCIPGLHRLFVDVYGDMYMCERVGAFGRLGTLWDEGDEIVAARSSLASRFDGAVGEPCSNCYLVRICDMCFSVLRRGADLCSADEMARFCERKRRWFDSIIYAYLGRKELGKGLFN